VTPYVDARASAENLRSGLRNPASSRVAAPWHWTGASATLSEAENE